MRKLAENYDKSIFPCGVVSVKDMSADSTTESEI